MRKIRYDRIAGVLMVLVLVWIVASFIDINLHNHPFTANYQHFAKWNAFILIFDKFF